MAKAAPKKKQKLDLIDKASKLTTVGKIIVFAASTLLLGAGFYGLFFMPYDEAKSSLESGINRLNQEIAKQNTALKQHRAVSEYSPAITTAHHYMQKFLPQENEMPRLVQMVSEIGSRAGLSDGVTLFAPKLPAVVRENYAEIPFTMNLEGEFLTILNFLYSFSRMDRIVNITDVRIGSPKMVDERREIFHITVNCAGSTYRALTEAELEEQSKPKTNPKAKKR